MSDINKRLEVLNTLFYIYGNHAGQYDNACHQGCASCCTRNVTLTTLEAKHILAELSKEKQNEVIQRIEASIEQKRFIPQVTINQMAKMCIEGQDLPEEECDPAWGTCPLLQDNSCMIYDVRPFACRCMVSKNKCDTSDLAQMDEYIITLNNLFIQYIEHIALGGLYGNFSDVMLYEVGKAGSDNLISNVGVEMLMVPPQHQEKIMKVVEELRNIQV